LAFNIYVKNMEIPLLNIFICPQDMSREMLEVLTHRKVYKNVFCNLVGGGHRISVDDNSYDAVTVCGGYAVGHMPVDSLLEIHRVLKPG